MEDKQIHNLYRSQILKGKLPGCGEYSVPNIGPISHKEKRKKKKEKKRSDRPLHSTDFLHSESPGTGSS